MNFLTTLAQSEQHIYGFEGTTAVAIFTVGFVGLLILIALTVKINFRLALLGAILFATALTAAVDFDKMVFVQTWMLPIQKLRAEIQLALSVLLTIMVIAPGRLGMQHVTPPPVILLILGLYMALLQFVHDGAAEGAKSLGFALATIPCMIFAVPLATRTSEQCVLLLKTIMVVSVLWTFCCSVQFVIDPKCLVNANGRFWGMLGNAQHAAILVAPFAVIALWLILNDAQRRARILWITLLAINLLFLIWTGSRNGALMFLLGAGFVLYSRGGRAIAYLPLAAGMFIALYFLSNFLQIGSNLERLTSTEDTRQHIWTHQIATGLANPIFGIGWNEGIGGSESSYLAAFAAYGMGGLILLLALAFASLAFCVRLFRNKAWLPEYERPLVDLFIAFNVMYFAGGLFEGYLVARASTTLTMMLMFAGIGSYLRERIAQSMAEHAEFGYAAHELNPHDEHEHEGGHPAESYN